MTTESTTGKLTTPPLSPSRASSPGSNSSTGSTENQGDTNPDANSDSNSMMMLQQQPPPPPPPRPNNVDVNAHVIADQQLNIISPTHTPTRSNSSSSLSRTSLSTEERVDVSSSSSFTCSSSSHQIHPYSDLSPRVPPQSYIIERVQSSPCVLDASPKVAQRKGQLTQHGPSQLTPITRNGEKYDDLEKSMFRNNVSLDVVSNLCVPGEHSLKGKSSKESQKNMNQMIRPRGVSCLSDKQSTNNDDGLALRPISPPTRSTSIRPATAVSTSTSTQSINANSTARFDSPQDRFTSSSLESHVKLDRTHYSVPIISTTTFTKDSTNQRTCTSPHQSSPESVMNTPEPLSPADSSILHIPYQPTRDKSLTSFGVVPDELEDIFLPLRTTNKLRRSSKDKVVLVNGGRGGSGAIGINRSSAFGYIDDEDACTHISDSQSATSIPSIRLGVRIRSSTQDSYTTYDGADEDDEEDHIFSLSTLDDEDDDDCSASHDGMHFRSHQYTDGVSSTRRKKNQRGSTSGSGSKYLSSKKEKQVYEWLRTLEVDKDNNEYVAEAASSKFLTGKMREEEPILNYDNDRLYIPEKTRGIHQRQHLGRLGALNNIQPTIVENADSLELKVGNGKDCTSTSSSIKASNNSSSTNNKIVMGRNICAFNRTSGVKTRPKVKGSGFYR